MTSIYNDSNDREMLENAHMVIDRMEKWEFLKNYNPDPNKGFLWDDDETINQIKSEIYKDYPNHSVGSISLVMRVMKNTSLSK
jgi:hypothetical protein